MSKDIIQNHNSFSALNLWQCSFMPSTYLSLYSDYPVAPQNSPMNITIYATPFRENGDKTKNTPHQKTIRVDEIKHIFPSI